MLKRRIVEPRAYNVAAVRADYQERILRAKALAHIFGPTSNDDGIPKLHRCSETGASRGDAFSRVRMLKSIGSARLPHRLA